MSELKQEHLDLFAVENFTSFGKRLESLRKSRNLTQSRLCIKSGVSRTSISAYECNKRKPRPVTIQMLAKALKVSSTTLEDVQEFYSSAPKVLDNFSPETGLFFLYREE
jgi:transcriptional regulator with XRE-family HTH domain